MFYKLVEQNAPTVAPRFSPSSVAALAQAICVDFTRGDTPLTVLGASNTTFGGNQYSDANFVQDSVTQYCPRYTNYLDGQSTTTLPAPTTTTTPPVSPSVTFLVHLRQADPTLETSANRSALVALAQSVCPILRHGGTVDGQLFSAGQTAVADTPALAGDGTDIPYIDAAAAVAYCPTYVDLFNADF